MKTQTHSFKRYCGIVFCSLALFACSSTNNSAPTRAAVENTGDAGGQIIENNTNTVLASATGQVRYSGRLDADERALAESNAKVGLIRKYVNRSLPDFTNNLIEKEAELISSIDDFFITKEIVGETDDEDNNTYSVSIRGTIDEPRLVTFLTEFDPNAKRSVITFVFVARENPDHGLPDAQRTKKDVVEWRFVPTTAFSAAISQVLVNNRFSVDQAEILEEETNYEFEVADFIADYASGDDISANTLSDSLKGLRGVEPKVDYLAYGTLDIDRSFNDPVTGNVKVAVSVTGRAIAIHLRGRQVASVGPVQYFGEGATYQIATNNALRSAAESAAKTIAAQLRAQSIN